MSFIGNSFTSQQFTPAVDYFNGNSSTTAFTLSKTVGSVYDIQVVIENVPQNPASAFTVSGNVITFTSAPPTGTNNIYVRYTSPMTNVVKPAPGTVSPTEINSAYSLWNLSGSNINYTAGNVGVGTASPSGKFHVASTSLNGYTYNSSFTQLISESTSAAGISIAAGPSSIGGLVFANSNGGSDGYMIYDNSNRYMAMATGGSERMRIRSDGNVGISCQGSANYKLMVNSTSPNQEVVCIQTLNTNTGTGLAGEGPLMLQNTNKTNNNMAAISNFDGNGNINTQINFVNTDQGGGGAIAFTTRTDGGASYGERMRINQNGDIAVGLVIPRAHFDVGQSGGSTGAPMSISRGGDAGILVNFFTTHTSTTSIGNIYNAGLTSTQYNTSSDYRLKENIVPMTGALQKVSLLKPCTYTWKVNGEDGQGFIAHELQEIFPDAVHGEKDAVDSDGNIVSQGIDTSYLVATLTAAIQEQQAIIENLKSRIEVLEAK